MFARFKGDEVFKGTQFSQRIGKQLGVRLKVTRDREPRETPRGRGKFARLGGFVFSPLQYWIRGERARGVDVTVITSGSLVTSRRH